MDNIFILLAALALDLAFGEPSDRWHPVAWLGKVISLGMKWAPRRGNLAQMVFGIAAVLITLGIVTAAGYFLFLYLQQFSRLVYVIVGGVLLKFTFSLRGLRQAATTVRELLARDNLAGARTSLRALVGRDTAGLDKSHLISAAVESVAENSTDSFVAPLFYFVLFGVPGAAAYRVVNTFDSMIGHHGEWEYLGKFAARLDTAANLLPARLGALMLIAAAWLSRNSPRRAWQVMLRDRRKTASPNAGWTMSAMAGALGVQLEKIGYYRLGDNHNSLSLRAIETSGQMVMISAALWSLILILAEVIYFAAT
ncbi:MAG: cobalamin biosynthesis protein [Chloroflexota bacterium]|nr:cobalamin biosynthesis protein [Chloroflexota bacterium]